MNSTGGPGGLARLRQFISWRIGADIKDKFPCDEHGNAISVNDQAQWVDYATVVARPWRAGLVLAAGLVLIDLDGCIFRMPDGSEQISEFARATIARFPGAYIERSVSGTGVHIIFTASCLQAGHQTRRKGLAIEVYSWGRFAALGEYWGGDVTVDHTAALSAAMGEWGLRTEPTPPIEVEAGRNPEWIGPEDDEALIQLMLNYGRRERSAAEVFDGKPTVAELWNLDTTALTRYAPQPGRADGCPWDRTIVDAMMMAELNFFTGKDRPRMCRLFMRWPGYRPAKHEQAGGYRLVRALNVGCGHNRAIRIASAPAPVLAVPAAAEAVPLTGRMGDFLAHLPDNTFFHRPTGKYWPAKSVDNTIPAVGVNVGGVLKSIPASKYIAQHQPIHEVTWFPGAPQIIEDYILRGGVWQHKPSIRSLNTYEAPAPLQPRGGSIEPWLWHIRKVYPGHAEYMLDWMAFASQNPAVKINHAIVLGGAQGLGKDSMLRPLRRAVGEMNYQETKPEVIITEKYNPYLQCRILRINEAKDTGGESRFQFYEKTKTIIAAPPEVHVIRDLYSSPYQIPNLNNTIITTNYRTGGMYLPPDDRRHYVMFSDLSPSEFTPEYWVQFHAWMNAGGEEDCAAYLMSRDVSHFNPKASPPRTDAFWAMCEAGESDETSDLSDLLDGHMVVTISQLVAIAELEKRNMVIAEWLKDPKKGKAVNRALQDLGWVPVRNDGDKRGRWYVGGKRCVVYSHQNYDAAHRLSLVASYVGRSAP